jgi:hypothetical protein
MLVAELIRRKRDGGELSAEEIAELVAGIADGSVTDAQVGALAMAIVWRGMTAVERVALTGAMTRSGEVLEWDDTGVTGPILDKHSTGGVGDKVSLLLAPIVAACGASVPMISGRGLGTREARSTSSRRSPATTSPPTRSGCARRWPGWGARSSARPRAWRPPTAACTRSATPPRPSSRSR